MTELAVVITICLVVTGPSFLLSALLVARGRIRLSTLYLIDGVSCVVCAVLLLALGYWPAALSQAGWAAWDLYRWWRGRRPGGWRRLKSRARSKLPRLTFVQLRPGLGATT